MDKPREYDLIIEPGKPIKQYWLDLWQFRELFTFLAWRDITVRYKQTAIGIVWAIIRPLMTMVVFTLVFHRIAKLTSGEIPYPLLVFTGMVAWQFFADSLNESSNSVVGNANIISKIYFPRLIIPTSATIVVLMDFLLSFAMLIVLLIFYQFIPSWRIVLIPLFLLLGFCSSLGLGLWFSALNVKFRDFRYVVPFVLQFGLYVSPVGFSSSIVPPYLKLIYYLNPMVSVIDGFRWSILGRGNELYIEGLVVSVVLAAGLFLSGIWYFRKMERGFADII